MTNSDILETALAQSAVDLSCRPEDLQGPENVLAESKKSGAARRYLELPFVLNIVTYGGPAVFSAGPGYMDAAGELMGRYPGAENVYRLMETPGLHAVDELFAPLGCRTRFMAEYFLPDIELLRRKSCDFNTKILTSADFAPLYVPEWSNALCYKRRELDVLGVGAYDGDRLVGLAACSADCETMWQIGVDVLPEYRRRGIASALTSALALEIIDRGRVPFYCAAWSNIRSVRNAIASGFRPAWAELTVKSTGTGV